MASKTRKIDAMRNDETGEIAPPHQIGTTRSGASLYVYVHGWSPVAQLEDGTYVPPTGVVQDRDGNYSVRGSKAESFYFPAGRPTGV
jgi:hypothetical protein